MADIDRIVRIVFGIPESYEMSEFERKKLYNYVQEARSAQEARLFRILDCSAFCNEDKCYFCGEHELDLQ